MTVKNLITEYLQQVAEYSAKKIYDYEITQKRADEFSEKIRNLHDPIDEVATALENYVDNPCEGHLTLWIRVAEIRPSVKYIDALCKILEQENNCIWHEGIMYVFDSLKDPRTIPALEKAIGHNLNYENTKQVAVKAMETLAEIGTPEAIQIIEKCRSNPDELIKEVAYDILDYINTR